VTGPDRRSKLHCYTDWGLPSDLPHLRRIPSSLPSHTLFHSYEYLVVPITYSTTFPSTMADLTCLKVLEEKQCSTHRVASVQYHHWSCTWEFFVWPQDKSFTLTVVYNCLYNRERNNFSVGCGTPPAILSSVCSISVSLRIQFNPGD
jgi:hypothetical protein